MEDYHKLERPLFRILQCKAGVERHCQLCGRREKARPRCDGCCKTVCQRCLERVLGPEQQRAVQDLDAWLCFSCDVAPLVALELELRRFEGRGRLEGRDNKEGVQEQNGGAVGVDQGGVGMARSGVDQKGGGQNDFGTVREGVSHGSEGHATLAIKVQTDRTEQPEERATFPLQGRNRTKVIAGAPGINEASASQNGNGPEVHACSWADCGKVFPTGPARNGHLLEHFRPCASGEEIGAGTSLSGEQLGKYSGELGTGGHSTRTESWGRRKQEEANRGAGEGESPLAAQPGFTDGRAGTEKGNGSTGKRKGSTTEGTKSEDGAEGAASQAGPGPGLAEPKARNPGTGKEEEPVFACVACGASGKRSVERQHPSLPLPVCQDCLRTIDSADFKEKVRPTGQVAVRTVAGRKFS